MAASEAEPLGARVSDGDLLAPVGNIPAEERAEFLVPESRLDEAHFIIDGVKEFIGTRDSRLSCAGFVLKRYAEDDTIVNSIQHPPFRKIMRRDDLWQATSLIETLTGDIYSEYHYYHEKLSESPRSGQAHRWTGLEWAKTQRIIEIVR